MTHPTHSGRTPIRLRNGIPNGLRTDNRNPHPNRSESDIRTESATDPPVPGTRNNYRSVAPRTPRSPSVPRELLQVQIVTSVMRATATTWTWKKETIDAHTR